MKASINLLPWRTELRFKRGNYFKKKLSIILGIIGCVLTIWHVMLLKQIDGVMKQTHNLQQAFLSAQQRRKDKDITEQLQQKTQRVNSKIVSLEKQRFDFIQVFENLHRGMPASLRLTKIVIKDNNIKLFGKADSIFGIMRLVKAFNQALIQKIDRQDDEYNFTLELPCGN